MPNIQILKFIREQRRLDLAEVAAFTSISAERLADFEEGNRGPSRKQMERLADAYGVPLYSLFGKTLPNLPPLPTDFRQKEPSEASLSPKGVRALLASERIAEFTKQLTIELDYQPVDLSKSARLANSPSKRAAKLRSAFDNWLMPREKSLGFSGPNEQRFMGALRLFFEVQGGVAIVNDAPSKDYLGFFSDHSSALPTIFINRSVSSKKAQLFTLAHEYAHALMGAEGISDPFQARNSIERSCNIFAAEFLAPMDEFARVAEGFSSSTRESIGRWIDATSARTLLSKHATAIRLVEGDYITQSQLRAWLRPFKQNPNQEKDEEKEASNSDFGVPHAKRLSELGHLSVAMAAEGVEAKIIDSFDVAEGIGLSRSLQDKAFKLARKRFEAAVS